MINGKIEIGDIVTLTELAMRWTDEHGVPWHVHEGLEIGCMYEVRRVNGEAIYMNKGIYGYPPEYVLKDN